MCQDDVLGFGNSTIECPYKKVEAGKERFSSIVHNIKTSEQDELIENLLQLLKSRERYM